MTNTQLFRKAIRLYSNDLATIAINKHNRRSWLKSISFLGDKWVLANVNSVGRTNG